MSSLMTSLSITTIEAAAAPTAVPPAAAAVAAAAAAAQVPVRIPVAMVLSSSRSCCASHALDPVK